MLESRKSIFFKIKFIFALFNPLAVFSILDFFKYCVHTVIISEEALHIEQLYKI